MRARTSQVGDSESVVSFSDTYGSERMVVVLLKSRFGNCPASLSARKVLGYFHPIEVGACVV